jgi:hypothetical protein
MSVVVLVVLIAGAFALSYGVDTRNILRLAAERRWSEPRVTWTPGSLLRSRAERSYWLRYRDEDGRAERRLCRVTSYLDGPYGVTVEPAAPARVEREPGSPAARRVRLIVVSTAAGLFLGVALGILGAFALYPGSNIAPAYGVIFGLPAGLVAGVLFGVLRR